MGVPIRDLIKMREEVRMNPSTEVSTPLAKPKTNVEVPTLNPLAGSTPQKVDYDSENKYRAAMISKGAPEPVASKPEEQKVSLYEIGKQNAGASNIAKAESVMKNPSPITSPEYEKFREQVIGAQQFGVETPEQAAARERRDFIKQGLTGFTEGLSALANLYYTTKGAPSQKLTSQMPELSKRLYAERLERDKKLENFRAWQRAKADKEEERAYNLNLFNLKQEAADKAAQKKAKIDAQAAEIKYLRDLGLIDARKEADLVKQKGKASLDKELEAIRQQNRVALAGINNQAAMDRVAAKGGGSNATIRVPIGDDGQYAEYRKNDLTNPIVISQIYNSLPDDYRVREEKGIKTNEQGEVDPINGKYPYDENPSTQKMQEAIGKALSDGYLTEMAPEIQVGGEKKKYSKGEDNTPPSRRKNNHEDNIPPSKRNK